MFGRRRRRDGDDPDEATEVADEAGVDGARAELGGAAEGTGPPRPQGPWDADDVPDDAVPRVDLGGLHVPVSEGLELRVDVSPEGTIVAATLVAGTSTLQLNAFAAPRSEGIWGDIRDEIAASLAGGGGAAEPAEGPFGPELRARVPAQAVGPDGRVVSTLQPARFVGVDGPRWFLRGLFTGPAATDPVQAGVLENALRGVVVVRGKDPMAVRDALPLRLPSDVQGGAGHEDADDGDGGDGGDGGNPLALQERGPEITEVR